MERGRKTFFWDRPLKYNYDPNLNPKTKMYIFKQIAQYFGLKTNLLQGLKEKKKKKITKNSLQIRIWKCDNKNNGLFGIGD